MTWVEGSRSAVFRAGSCAPPQNGAALRQPAVSVRGCERFDATQSLADDGRRAGRPSGGACVPAVQGGGRLVPVAVLGDVRGLLQVDQQPAALPGPPATLPEQ